MTRKSILPLLGLAVAMIFAAPKKASAEVFVGVNIGPVVPRHGYVVVAPRPYAYGYYPRAYGYYPPRVWPAPVVVRPWGGYYHERWYPRHDYARGYYGPRHFRR
jgi:hypothetical protein